MKEPSCNTSAGHRVSQDSEATNPSMLDSFKKLAVQGLLLLAHWLARGGLAGPSRRQTKSFVASLQEGIFSDPAHWTRGSCKLKVLELTNL